MPNLYFIGVLVLVLTTITSRIIIERALSKLDTETKVKLLDIFAGTRILSIIIYPLFFIALYFTIRFFPATMNIFWLVSFYLLLLIFISGFMGWRVYKKLKAAEVPKVYLNAFLFSRILSIVRLLAIVLFLFYVTNMISGINTKMDAANYVYNARKESSVRHYKEALLDYDKAIEIDNTNPVYYNNRGTTKYYLHDLPGACADWKKAYSLGDIDAKMNLDNFCK